MIPELIPVLEKLDLAVVFIPLALGVLVTAALFLAQSIAAWFDDRNP